MPKATPQQIFDKVSNPMADHANKFITPIYGLQDGEYIRLECDEKGIIKSQVFSGLWLAVESMLSGAMSDVLGVLQSGLK